ncbi:MAG: hypothetical protein K6E68_09710 [Lachnospiraceae bacterium]|nr:hypothetical protein [Lachnospiraceae bacterium]
MTLLTVLFAAVIVTAVWYNRADDDMQIVTLMYLYWGASLMWFVDAIYEYAELGTAFFEATAEDMLNDAFLGLAAIALGLVIWIVRLLITDPKGKIKTALSRK